MLKRAFLLIFLTTILSQALFSQKNYLGGYIINLKGDTLIGFINYANWDRNPDIIQFKNCMDCEESKFSPSDILEFGVVDERYKSAIVDVEISPEKPSRTKEDPQLHLVKDTVFLQSLFIGQKSLFLFRSREGKDNFYIEDNEGIKLLVYKKYVKFNNEVNPYNYNYSILENNRFKGQLNLYFAECQELKQEIENLKYTKNSLSKLYQRYYKYSKTEAQFLKPIDKIQFESGVKLGATSTSINFTGGNEYLIESQLETSVDFTAGLFLDFIFPRNNKKWSLGNEFLYTTYHVTGRYEDFNREEDYSITTTSFENDYLNINTLIKYNHPIGKNFRLCLNAGFSNNFAIKQNNTKTTEIKFYTTESTETEDIDVTVKYDQGFFMSTGVKIHNISGEIRYRKGTGIALKSDIQTWAVLLSYSFF